MDSCAAICCPDVGLDIDIASNAVPQTIRRDQKCAFSWPGSPDRRNHMAVFVITRYSEEKVGPKVARDRASTNLGGLLFAQYDPYHDDAVYCARGASTCTSSPYSSVMMVMSRTTLPSLLCQPTEYVQALAKSFAFHVLDW